MQHTGNHQGLLIFAEAQMQPVEESSFQEMLRHALGREEVSDRSHDHDRQPVGAYLESVPNRRHLKVTLVKARGPRRSQGFGIDRELIGRILIPEHLGLCPRVTAHAIFAHDGRTRTSS